MTSRGTKWALHTGFAVIAVPESGLFFREGRLVTGNGADMTANEMILFSRRFDADKYAQYQERNWENSDAGWSFPVIPVMVSERK